MSSSQAIRTVVFDMDGVLIDAKEWHYEALNSALELFGYRISLEDHLSRFDGLPTKRKLETLSIEVGLPPQLHKMINNIKQERTLRIAAQYCFPKPNLLTILTYLKNEDYRIGLATNSIRQTTEAMMRYSGLWHFFDSVLTNEDVGQPKPNPEIYLKSCQALGSNPFETLVFEDNHHGIDAAKLAGCQVFEVVDPNSLFLDEVLERLGR